jgi:spermidine synthase
MSRPSPRRQSVFGILFCFFLSGAAGLIYQVAWSKALGLVFGHTVYAISTVLAVFMAGLAAGSAYIGRWGQKQSNPIVLYSRLELLVAATGALSLAGLAAVRWLYFAAYPSFGGFPSLLLLLRVFGSAFVLFIPTFFMGGTFPVLVRGLTQRSAELSIRVSLLYWVNTLGAVAGTLIAGFVLLPAFGLRITIAIAVVLSLLAGIIASRIGKSAATSSEAVASRAKAPAPASELTQPSPAFLLFLFAVVGGTAFAYEIAWTRLLAITIGSSTYAFTLILAAFLAGSVIGSVFFQRFFARSRSASLATFSRTQTWTGVVALSSLLLFPWIASIIPLLLRVTHQSFGGLILAQLVTAAATVLPIALVFGFNFPAVLVLLGRNAPGNPGESASVGKAYAANALGAIVGSLVAGFWLVSWLGNFRLVAFTAGVNLLLALALALRSSQRRVLSLAANLVCLLAVILVGSTSFFYNKSLMFLSAVLYGNSFHGHLTLKEIANASDLVFTADGVNDSIAVFRSDNYVSLRVNGKTDASTGDARTQLLLGHLGAAFHPSPRHVLIIGFGSGMTASAVARYRDVEKIDCVEIEPAVIRAAPYLETLNRGVLNDPRMHIIYDDARNFLLTSREKYDLIISEPSNPWIAGVATLFTTEYYDAIRQKLAPGGIFVQWLQAYSITPADLRMVVASLVPHFVDVTLWHAEGPDLLLLARVDPSLLQFRRLRSLWLDDPLRADFEQMDLHQPEGLVAYFSLDDAALRKLAAGGTLNTDNRTLLEYHAPRTMLREDLFDVNQELINRFRTSVLPSNLDPAEIPRALEAGAIAALDLKDNANAQKFLDALASGGPSAIRYIAEGRLDLARDALTYAKSNFVSALRLEPGSPDAMHWLAVAEHRAGDDTASQQILNQLLVAHPQFLPALTDEMQFAADRRDYRIALLAQLQRMKVIPRPPASEYCRLGAIWMKLGNQPEAEESFLEGLMKDPYSYACNLDLGELYRRTGRFALARQNFELIVRFYPDYDPTVFPALASVYRSLDEPGSANAILHKGLRLFPADPALQSAVNSSAPPSP